MKIKIKRVTNRRLLALVLCTFVVAVFSMMQAFETKSATTDQVTLQVTVAENLSVDCGTDPVSLGTLTAGTPVTASSTCTVTTNDDAGYDLQVKRDDATSTMDHNSDAATDITDMTAWNPSSPNAAEFTTDVLAFRVYTSTASHNTTWWGTDTSCPHSQSSNALYAGFPTAYADIMQYNSYSSSSTTSGICYILDVPSTQKSGAYSGTITYQVVGGT